MTIEVPAAELYALAAVLRAGSARALESHGRLDADVAVGDALQDGVESFAESARIAAGALAGELGRLGSSVARTADSWLGLDGSVLPVRGEARAR